MEARRLIKIAKPEDIAGFYDELIRLPGVELINIDVEIQEEGVTDLRSVVSYFEPIKSQELGGIIETAYKQKIRADLENAREIVKECELQLKQATEALKIAQRNKRNAEGICNNYIDSRYTGFSFADWSSELVAAYQNGPRSTDLSEEEILVCWKNKLRCGYDNRPIKKWVQKRYQEGSDKCKALIEIHFESMV